MPKEFGVVLVGRAAKAGTSSRPAGVGASDWNRRSAFSAAHLTRRWATTRSTSFEIAPRGMPSFFATSRGDVASERLPALLIIQSLSVENWRHPFFNP